MTPRRSAGVFRLKSLTLFLLGFLCASLSFGVLLLSNPAVLQAGSLTSFYDQRYSFLDFLGRRGGSANRLRVSHRYKYRLYHHIKDNSPRCLQSHICDGDFKCGSDGLGCIRTARERRLHIVNATRSSWAAYKQDAWGADELHPQTKTGRMWFDLGITIVDSLDTLLLMDLKEEYAGARAWVEANLAQKISVASYVSTFEVTIRLLGGLVATFYHSGGDPLYRDLAADLGDRLLCAFRTGSGLARMQVSLQVRSSPQPPARPIRPYIGSTLHPTRTLLQEPAMPPPVLPSNTTLPNPTISLPAPATTATINPDPSAAVTSGTTTMDPGATLTPTTSITPDPAAAVTSPINPDLTATLTPPTDITRNPVTAVASGDATLDPTAVVASATSSPPPPFNLVPHQGAGSGGQIAFEGVPDPSRQDARVSNSNSFIVNSTPPIMQVPPPPPWPPRPPLPPSPPPNPPWPEQQVFTTTFADAGTLSVEFTALSYLTGQEHFKQKAMVFWEQLAKAPAMRDGLFCRYIDTALNCNDDVYSLGESGDSAYEYMLKQWILSGRQDTAQLEMYKTMMRGARKHLLGIGDNGCERFMYPRRATRSAYQDVNGTMAFRLMPDPTLEQLACFAPGMMALGWMYGIDTNEPGEMDDLELAIRLARGCYQLYVATATGLNWDVAYVAEPRTQEGKVGVYGDTDCVPNLRETIHPTRPVNMLRPELIESFFYLYRATGDTMYQDWGWSIFRSFHMYSKMPNGEAYTDVPDPNTIPVESANIMESFWLAETLKYLYLLFSPKEYIPLNKFVFNTEAHPLPIHGTRMEALRFKDAMDHKLP